MVTYTARITLVLSSLRNYEELHKNLLTEFSGQQIKKHKEYKNIAGPREYLIQSPGPVAVVNQAVQRAARATGKEYYFTLIKAKETTNTNLVAV